MINGYRELYWTLGMLSKPKKNGFVYEHREVAAQKIGRALTDKECVHHVDEVRSNNTPSNLIIFRSNADHSAFHKGADLIDCGDGTFGAQMQAVLCDCGRVKCGGAVMCGECNLRVRRRNTPSIETLRVQLWEMPTSTIARLYGVSDTAVSKWARRYGLEKPSRGYWQKKASASSSIGRATSP